MAKKSADKTVEALKYEEATRKNIPTAEYQSVVDEQTKNPMQVRYSRKYTELLYQIGALHNLGKVSDEFQEKLNRDLDPQLIWRGKDEQDWSDLVVHAPPLYIQEKVHPKALINDLLRETRERRHESGEITPDLFADFNGIPKEADKTEFYQHDQNWSNRMILGDSLQVMASLAEREGLRGKVQCIYFDPPYGIKFNSNFQWSTTSRDVKDGKVDHITREPEQVKAFRDTWRDGIHSYLTYLRDRLTVARDLLTESGSIFVQIGDENVHRVRAVMDEVFGKDNCMGEIYVAKTSGFGDTKTLAAVGDYLLWYSKHKEVCKYRQLYQDKGAGSVFAKEYRQKESPDGYIRMPLSKDEMAGLAELPSGWKRFRPSATTSQGSSDIDGFSLEFRGKQYQAPGGQHWKTSSLGLGRLASAGRLLPRDKSVSYLRYLDDFRVVPITNVWLDLRWGFDASEKRYVVETNPGIVHAVSSWQQIPAISCSTQPAVLVRPLPLPSNGVVAGSPLILRVWHWLWPAPVLWVRAIRFIC
jgi:adenine-specific DNA-methyltransferase